MSKLNFSTTSVDRTRNVIGKINENINKVGQEMGSGNKQDLEVVDSILVKNMQDYVDSNNSMLSQYKYQEEKLQSGISSMKAIEKNLSQQLKIVREKPDNSDARAALNALLQNYRMQFNNEVKDANHLGQPLLTGEVGSTVKLTQEYKTMPASIKNIAVLANAERFADRMHGNVGANEAITVTFNGTTVGSAITIRGETIRFINTVPTDSNQVQIGSNNAETAANFAKTIQKHPAESLKFYRVNIDNAARDVVALKVTHQEHNDNINLFRPLVLANSHGIAIANDGNGVLGAISLGGITENSDFIGNLNKYKFENILVADTGATVQNLCKMYGGFDPGTGSGNSRAAAYRVKIGEEYFQGVINVANKANVNNYKMKFQSTSSGQNFTINFSNGYNELVAGGVVADNAAAVCDNLNELFRGLTVQRTKYMGHKGIGFMEDAQVLITSSKNEELVLQDVIVEVDAANANNTKLTMKMNDINYTASVSTNQFYVGKNITLTAVGADHIISLTLGKNMPNISSEIGKKQLASDITKSLGIKAEEIAGIKIDFPMVAETDVFRDPKTKEYYPMLSMKNEKDQKIAEEVLTAAVQKTRAELSKLEQTQKLLTSSKDNVVDKNSNLTKAIDDRQSIDYLSSMMLKNQLLSELRVSFSMIQTQLQLFSLINKLVDSN